MSDLEEPVKIEKNIPIPERPRRGVPAILKTMDVGDSVVIGKFDQAMWYQAALSLGYKVTTRIISNTERRAWRTA